LIGDSKSRDNLGKALCPDSSPYGPVLPPAATSFPRTTIEMQAPCNSQPHGATDRKNSGRRVLQDRPPEGKIVSVVSFTLDPGASLCSSFLRDNSGPERDLPIRENPTLPRVPARVASAVPQRWSSSCKVSLSFKKVKRRQIIRPSGHTSIARAGGRSKPLASSRHPLRGAIRGYRETCAISDPRTGFFGKILRFVGRGRMPLVRRAPPASIEVAGARPCDPRRPYLRRGRDLS
jgi:hypothetical protein